MEMNSSHVRWGPLFYSGLLALSVVAFWPGYLAVPKGEIGGWTHFHAATGTLWLVMLIVQPWAIRSGRRALHVAIGRASVILFALVIVAFVGLAHASMQGKSPAEQAVDAYFFYIRVVLVGVFAATYLLGIAYRRNPEVHSRYMLCTGLPLIDPVVHRIAQRSMAGADYNYQLLTFAVVCAVLVVLIPAARHSPPAQRALIAVLVAFAVLGLPLALDFHTWGAPWTAWKALARQFAELPLT